MFRKLIILFSVFFSVHAMGAGLSPDARVSLLTCGVGNEIHSFFGHTALRIEDQRSGIDYTFNYGVFSFDAPNFVYRFAKGETDYQLGVSRTRDFIAMYRHVKRSVVEQEILLEHDEIERLYAALIENFKPENRIYRYNFFFDNCATRIRDRVEEVLPGAVNWGDDPEPQRTFRDMVNQYVPANTWIDLGIKLALGMPADQVISDYQKMFLPDYVMYNFERATVERNGVETLLCGPPKTVYQAPKLMPSFSVFSPLGMGLFVVVSLIVISVIGLVRKKHRYWIDSVLFLSFGVAGLILSFLTFISEHPTTEYNLNLMWAFPLHLFFGLILLKASWRQHVVAYYKFTAILLALFLVSIAWLPQTFHWMVIPLSLLLLTRSVFPFLQKRTHQ